MWNHLYRDHMKAAYKQKNGKIPTAKYIEGHRLLIRGWAGGGGRMRGTREDKKGMTEGHVHSEEGDADQEGGGAEDGEDDDE